MSIIPVVRVDFIKRETPYGFDRDEYEDITEFELLLQEFHAFYEGKILFSFTGEHKVEFSYFEDVVVIYVDILQLIDFLDTKDSKSDEVFDLWACEQGSNFHLLHKFNSEFIAICFEKGTDCGYPNRSIEDFVVNLDAKVYSQAWKTALSILCFRLGEISKNNNSYNAIKSELARINSLP